MFVYTTFTCHIVRTTWPYMYIAHYSKHTFISLRNKNVLSHPLWFWTFSHCQILLGCDKTGSCHVSIAISLLHQVHITCPLFTSGWHTLVLVMNQSVERRLWWHIHLFRAKVVKFSSSLKLLILMQWLNT